MLNPQPESGIDPESVEPVAIVGIGCRLPGGVVDWQSYWQLLLDGRDAITRTPADRWSLQKFYAPDGIQPGKTQSQWGGYVDGIDQFDPQLFGISPREAASMDPQQRLLLETTWRALEDAGQPVEKLAGRSVAVFAGISGIDYAVATLSFQDRGVLGPYSNTGGSSSIAANRISWCFDLRGPSVAVDTACSSSLVAVHLACQSILRGECEMALAGGVNVILLPDFQVAFSQLGVLSPTGRCKTFDASADGYVRAEGAGMVLLKPLSNALLDNDPIYAVIRGSALNQDGHTQGITLPNGQAQERLVRSACARANVDPADIQYVEAHGTGTAVGDPIEANALANVLGENRLPERQCWIGSVKTNIGHLEAGAGIASLIKVALSLHHKTIPAHLHFQSPNPQIDLTDSGLQIPINTTEWVAEPGSRLSGINGFGYGGANAHVILQELPTLGRDSRTSASPPQMSTASPILLPISARSKQALGDVAQEMADWLDSDNSGATMQEVSSYATHRRTQHEVRASVIGRRQEDWSTQLHQLAANDVSADLRLKSSQLDKGILFACSGQGPQWWGMGRQLLESSEVFRETIERCDNEFAKHIEWSLVEELQRDESESRMHETSISQPSIFALQVALAEVWKRFGVEPVALTGHSVGEIAAAYLCGALSWEDACCVAVHRGRTMDLASSRGAMIAVGLSPADSQKWIADVQDRISIAAINSPASITLSGCVEAIEDLARRFEEQGIFCRRLNVEYAFHSSQMEPVRDELLRSLADLRPQPSHTPMISTVFGGPINGTELDAEYWWRNVRQGVRFADAMRTAAQAGFGVALELGPHPVLTYSIVESFHEQAVPVRVFPSLHRERNDLDCMTETLGGFYESGVELDWASIHPQPQTRVILPPYPFQKQRCWSESFESEQSRLVASYHPLLGEPLCAPTNTWANRIDLHVQKHLQDHCVRDTCMLPAAAMFELVAAAAQQIKPGDTVTLKHAQLLGPCVLTPERPLQLQTTWRPDRRAIELACRHVDATVWQPLLTASVSDARSDDLFDAGALSSARERCTENFDANDCYQACSRMGLQYGARYRGLLSGVRRIDEVVADVELPAQIADESTTHGIHPALLDSCFHGIVVADKDFGSDNPQLFLPVKLQEMCLIKPAGTRVTCHVRLTTRTSQRVIGDIDILDETGQPCLLLRGLESQRAGRSQDDQSLHELVYAYRWQETDMPECDPAAAERTWCVFIDQRGLGEESCGLMEARNWNLVRVRSGAEYQQLDAGSFVIDPESRDDFDQLLQDIGNSTGHITDVVWLWGIDVPENSELTTESLERSATLTTLAPLNFVQAWESQNDAGTARFTMVTTGAQSRDGLVEPVEVGQSPLIGFGRVIISELARLQGKLVDVSTHDDSNAARELLNEIASQFDGEDEVIYRDGQRQVRRFTQLIDQPIPREAAITLPCRLRPGRSAGVDELSYRTIATPPPAAHEVEIEVLATGLNFSDVMKSLGLYPGLPDGPVNLGAECSGRVTRVGSEVGTWQVGDEVIAIAPGSFASHVTVDAELVARKPARLNHQQAATIPIAFLTAQYALHECARMQAGDRVLIHSASGGVGLAAMQLAQVAGVTIYGTAGSEEKRTYVRDRGAARVMDSRSLDFARQTMQATRGEGVDIVLNSLPGEAITQGLSILKTGGRFLEIGKRDIYADSPLGLQPFRNNLAFFAIDLDQLFQQQPTRMGTMLRNLVERFESGELQPLPVQSFPADGTRDAFRFMQQGKHIGKIAVDNQTRSATVLPGAWNAIKFEANATYWIAGGLGGFGLQVARWMAQRGAGSIVLSGRRQRVTPDAQQTINEISESGTCVTVLPADITKPDDVRSVLADIDANHPELRGIFHAAMVLEDKLLTDLDRPTLERVLRPKVLGGWNLHRETKDRVLDHFVLFSSLSSVFGHAGQANYAAANSFLDGLAHHRRVEGLPATVINWGYVGEAGYLADRPELGQRLERQGVLSFSVTEATDALEYALQTRTTQMSVLRMDWSLWRGLGLTSRESPRFAHLLQHAAGTDSTGQSSLASAADIRSASALDRLEMVREIVAQKLGALLGIDERQIEPDRPLLQFGLDSLMAVELRNWIENRLAINLPIASLMQSSGLDQLVETVCERLAEPDNTSGPTTVAASATSDSITADRADELLGQIPDMGDDEVSELLAHLLRKQEGG